MPKVKLNVTPCQEPIVNLHPCRAYVCTNKRTNKNYVFLVVLNEVAFFDGEDGSITYSARKEYVFEEYKNIRLMNQNESVEFFGRP